MTGEAANGWFTKLASNADVGLKKVTISGTATVGTSAVPVPGAEFTIAVTCNPEDATYGPCCTAGQQAS